MAPEGETALTWRPELHEAIRPYKDRMERQHLHRFSPFACLQPLMAVGATLDKIPAEYWSLSVDEEDFSVAVVSCPCGESPEVNAGGLVMCACERGFFFTSEEVFVVNSQKGRQPDDPAPDAAA